MGWLRGTGGSSNGDPHKELDRDLKDFLKRETPAAYQPAASKSIQRPPQAEQEQPNVPSQGEAASDPLPTESLFKDGRYAHLWKNYKPLSDIEDAAKSDQEKLMDVLEGYKERKRSIGRVALENCALEQFELQGCYANGTMKDRLVLCRKQRNAFDRCYNLQAQFLKTLGYLSTYDRPASVDEEIQMHADTLYHRMLDQEKAIAGAKAAGEAAPGEKVVGSTTATVAIAKAAASGSSPVKEEDLPPLSPTLQTKLKPEAQTELRKKLKGLPPNERDLLEKETLSEYAVAMEVQRLRTSVLEERKQRRDEGKGSFGDTISGWLGW